MHGSERMVHEPTALPFFQNTVTEISVPSGQLISNDSFDFHPKYDLPIPKSYHSGIGQDEHSRAFAEKCNTAFAAVQNTSPSIMRQPDGNSLVVASMPIPVWNDEDETWDNADPKMELRDGETIVAKVFTGLWAVKLTDYGEWLDNGGKHPDQLNHLRFIEYYVIDVVPGRYRWTVYCHNDEFDFYSEERMDYAKLELIEEYNA